MVNLSIIIVNYNTSALTCSCIQSIKDQTTTYSYEIILVDNASDQEDANEILRAFPDIQLIRNAENLGFGWANNIGMAAAKGEYFLLLNSDTLIIDGAIDKMMQRIQMPDCAQVGFLGCSLIGEDGILQPSVFPFAQPCKKSVDLFWLALRRNALVKRLFKAVDKQSPAAVIDYTREQKAGALSGACLLLKRAVYEQCGGFDTDFFMYCEETDWIRFKINNRFSCLYTPVARVIHLGGKSSTWGALQNYLSYFLYLYKQDVTYLRYYGLGEVLSKLIEWVAFAVCNHAEQRRSAWQQLQLAFYALLQIPRYHPSSGSRGRDFLRVDKFLNLK